MVACVAVEEDGGVHDVLVEEGDGYGKDRAGEKLGLLSAMATAMVWRGLTWRREGKERGGTEGGGGLGHRGMLYRA